MSQDVRIRHGLLYGMDRDGLRELLLPGVEYTNGDTFMPQSDPRATAVGMPFERFKLDPRRALQEFENAGWRRGPDGALLNRAGERVQIELRGNEPDERELAFVAAGWRQLGLEVSEYIPPSALARDNEFKSKFPGLETRARSTGDEIFVSFDGRLGSSPQNRWQGANTGHYANPALDRLIDKLESTISERDQGLVLKEMGGILADDMPALPSYFRSIFAAVGKGVRALDDYAFGQTGTFARQAHLWDRD
jgi:peptide/nickel transport system substrate-binding protein